MKLHWLLIASLLGTAKAWVSAPRGSKRPTRTTLSVKKAAGKSKKKAVSSPTAPVNPSDIREIDTTPELNRGLKEEYETPSYATPRVIDEGLLGDLTGGRPGAIIETEEELAAKDRIQREMEDGTRDYPDYVQDYGFLQELEDAEYDIDDPEAIDAGSLGTWTIQDLRSKFDYEWDPASGEPDPNLVEMNREGVRYVEETEKDDDGVEVGYDPVFGPSNPMDTRTILGAKDSFMIDDRTRDDSMITPQFPEGDPEIAYNEDVVQFRKSLDIMETYVDPFLPEEMEIPRHVARWHGYPEQMYLKPGNFSNNRFTDNPTDFDAMEPNRARKLAVEMARSKNAEWMPSKVSEDWHESQRAPYEAHETLVGTLRKGTCEPEHIVEAIQPALNVLGSCVELLSLENEGTVFRFAYHGLMKNKYGMSCWAQSLIEDCGVEVTGVVFETGFRRRDHPYDGGDSWYGPSN